MITVAIEDDGVASDFDATLFCAMQHKYNTRATTTVCSHAPPSYISCIMSDSETEPESDVPSSPEKACSSDYADVSTTSTLLNDSVAQLVNTPQTHSSDPINAVNSAVKILESLDFSLIRKVVPLSQSTNTTQTCTGRVFAWNHPGVINLTPRVLACRAYDESNLLS
jgi:hypothetical protein